jgi:hypothetical protein
MKSSTKILIGVGAVALAAMAYHFYKQSKPTEVAGTKPATDPAKPDLATQGILPGDSPSSQPSPDMHDVTILAPAGVDLPLPVGIIRQPIFPVKDGVEAAPLMAYTTIDMDTV